MLLTSGFKTYRDSLVNESCLYSLKTDAYLFYLDFQPEIFKTLTDYVTSNKKPHKANHVQQTSCA